MGSTCTLIVRDQQRTVSATSATSHDVNWFVNNIRLLNKDQKHLEEFQKKYEFRRRGKLVPGGQGITLVDFVKDVIIKYHDLTDIGAYAGKVLTGEAAARLERHGFNPEDSPSRGAAYIGMWNDDEYACVYFRELKDAGKVTSIINPDDPLGLKPFASERLLRLSYSELDQEFRKGSRILCHLDMSPFTVETYEARTKQGAVQVQQRMGELEFKFTKPEQRTWKTWMEKMCFA